MAAWHIVRSQSVLEVLLFSYPLSSANQMAPEEVQKRKHFLHPPDSLFWALEGQGNQAPVLGKILELSFGQYFLPAAVLERAQSSPRAPRRQLQLCWAGRHGAGIHRGRDKMVPVPAHSGHSPNCPPPGRTELGVTEDLGVTCGGWRAKGREEILS